MTNGADPPIIITGGSVSIEFNEQTFSGGSGKFADQRKKVVSVEVTDDNTGQTQAVTIPADGKCTIRVNTR